MFDYNATGTYILVVTLASLFLIVLLWQRQRSGKQIALWLSSGLAGVLLGAGGAAAVVQYLGYELMEVRQRPDALNGDEEDDEGEAEGRRGGGRRFGGGGPRAPSPKRQLTTLVRKLEILTGDIALNLSDEQAAAVCKVLADLDSTDLMTDEEAQGNYDELVGILNDDQKAKQEMIGLPRPPGGFGGGRRGQGGPDEDEEEDSNPFREKPNAQALKTVLQRLGGKADTTAEAPAETKPKP